MSDKDILKRFPGLQREWNGTRPFLKVRGMVYPLWSDYLPIVINVDHVVEVYRITSGGLVVNTAAGGSFEIHEDDEIKVFDRIGYKL